MTFVSESEALPLELGGKAAARLYWKRLLVFLYCVLGSFAAACLISVSIGAVSAITDALSSWKPEPYVLFPELLIIAVGLGVWHSLWAKLMQKQRSILANEKFRAKTATSLAQSTRLLLSARRRFPVVSRRS
jgi:hypothetical protein